MVLQFMYIVNCSFCTKVSPSNEQLSFFILYEIKRSTVATKSPQNTIV